MAKCWTYKYGADEVKVLNKGFNGSELYVNGELCDQKRGISLSDHLSVTLKGGEKVTATLEGTVTMTCSLLVNGTPLEPVDVK